MQREQVEHVARTVALQNAVYGLLSEADGLGESASDGLTITAQRDRDGTVSIDLVHTLAGMPVSGEGL